MKNYVELILIAEHLYRIFLDVVKSELQKMNVKDLNNIQALILYNIGKDTLTISDITGRRYYFGSNVSYNLRKMTEYGYIDHERSEFDKRAVFIKLSKKGLEFLHKLESAFDKHLKILHEEKIQETEIENMEKSIRTIEKCLRRLV